LSGRRDEFEQEVFEMTFVHRNPELTPRLFAEFSAYFHLRRKGNDRDPDSISDARLESFVDVAWVAGCQRTEDDEDLS